MASVTLKAALETLHSGNWCCLRFITANMAKKDGGKVRELAKCRIARNRPENESETAPPSSVAGKIEKPANHNTNFTRNVELQSGAILKIHPILITHINNTAVI